MPQNVTAPAGRSLTRNSNRSWLGRKLHRIRTRSQVQKQFKHLVIIIAAVLIAFILGFYFLGPSFSSGD